MAQDQPEFESALEAYPVRLDMFEGPLDLLIHLIKKNELNVYDIPIAHHHRAVSRVPASDAGAEPRRRRRISGDGRDADSHQVADAAPAAQDRTSSRDGEEEDPRETLVRRLLEHQKFKAAAELLHDRETLRSAQFIRPESAVADVAGEDLEPELEVDLFTLLAAFRGVLERAKARPECCCRRSRCRSNIVSSSCWSDCRRPRPPASRISLPTSTPDPT